MPWSVMIAVIIGFILPPHIAWLAELMLVVITGVKISVPATKVLKLSASAPISIGVNDDRVCPSKSSVTEAIRMAAPSAGVAAFKCKLVVVDVPEEVIK